MTNHAIVNKAGTVVNVVIWEGAAWLPPQGHYCIMSPTAGMGDTYDFEKNVFTKRVIIAADPVEETSKVVSLEDLQEQINKLNAQLLNK